MRIAAFVSLAASMAIWPVFTVTRGGAPVRGVCVTPGTATGAAGTVPLAGTAAVAEKTAAGLGLDFRVLRLPRNRGKGAAVREGVLAAAGEQVLVTDADLSTPIEEVDKLLAAGTAVAIGSRAVDETEGAEFKTV